MDIRQIRGAGNNEGLYSVIRFQAERTVFPPHFHHSYVFGVVTGGESVMLSGHCARKLQAGSVLVMNPLQVHRCAAPGTLDYTSVHVSPDTMRAVAMSLGYGDRLPLFQTTLSRDAAESLADALDACCSEQTQNVRFGEFLELLFRRCVHGEREQCLCEDVARACAVLDSEYATPLPLERLSRRCSLSVSALRRRFLRTLGVTPHAYLVSTRLEHARQLLRQGCSPADTAQQTGFCDQSHLTNVFRRYFGITPGAYVSLQNRPCTLGKPDGE